MENEQKLVTLLSTLTPSEANLIKSMLTSEGIEVFLQDEIMSQIYPSTLLGGIKLQVWEQDVETVTDFLKEGGFIKEEEK